jgi:putative phosphoesterase
MPVRIGVVSDTHGHYGNTREAVQRLAEWEVAEVLHCGDIGSPELVPLFARWPTHFVFGNVDRDHAGLRQAIEQAGQTCHGLIGHRLIAGRRIVFLHGDDARLFRQTVKSGEWDLVCYGHTHRPAWRQEAGTWLLNPGALYRARPHALAVVEVPDFNVQSITF